MLGMKVYLASPFFNDEQVKLVDSLKSLLEEAGYDVISPKDKLMLSRDSIREEIQRCFKMNCDDMDSADWVLANIEGWDPGTTWETGYMFRSGKPIVYFSDTPGRRLNVMLQQSGSFVNGLDDFHSKLDSAQGALDGEIF